MCRNQYHHTGYRSYGGNIPDAAQGSFYPGDAAGVYCSISNEPCGNTEGNRPEHCFGCAPTEWLCPECIRQELDGRLYYSQPTKSYICSCPDCQAKWSEKELLASCASLIMTLAQEQSAAYAALNEAKTYTTRMQETFARMQF